VRIRLETRLVIAALLTALFCVAAFLSGLWRLPERQTGWFESAAMLCLTLGVLDGALALRAKRDGHSEPPP
jgi:hypothetical protein